MMAKMTREERLERRWLKSMMCGLCEIRLTSSICGGYSGMHELPVIEGVRDKAEWVDLGPPCDMEAKRKAALATYKPRPMRVHPMTPRPIKGMTTEGEL